MTTVIGVRFRKAGKVYYFAPGELQIEKGIHVIVETARGVEYGTVIMGCTQVADEAVVHPWKHVIRIATKEDDEIKTLVSDFWAYSISVEYIENPDYKIVDSIFDRLNREGSRLNAQELRKAQYYDTLLYNDIISYRNDEYMTKLTYKLNKNRMEDVGFITELYIMTVKNTIFDGNENEIDKVFADIVDKYDEECSMSVRMKFEKILNLLKKWNIDYSAYNIEGVSHLYALWYLALYIDNNQIDADDICDKMNIFYRNLRSDKTIPQTVIYQQSMQSASRSKSARKKRVNAILTYLEYEKL